MAIYCQLEDPKAVNVSSSVLKRLHKQRPCLKDHFCTSESGRTSFPHLFEHLIIDEEIKLTDAKDFIFVGTTEWLNRSSGTAKIEINFFNVEKTIEAVDSALNLLKEAQD
ncbi:MAG: hypothetical protein HUJ51_01415 [Eggerthellaceae bacterium]|nr:hypothetical protein [Eggerthellaceae bacterium]